jgi:RecB family exonuclease
LADAGPAALTPEDARLLLLSPLAGALPSGLRVLGRRLRALERAAGAAFPRPSAHLIREVVLDPADLVAVDDWVATPVRRLHDIVAAARKVLHDGGTPEEALWVLWDGSGWARRLATQSAGGGASGRNADRDLDAVIALFEAAARLEERQPRAGVGTLLDELGMQEIPAAPQEERAGAPDAVRLMTAHRAKGLEWDLVVVSGVQDGVWPDLRRRASFLDSDAVDRDGARQRASMPAMLVDERRLFYVAVTRARRRLVLTAVSSVDEAGDRPSRLLEETGLDVPSTRLSGIDLLAPSSLVARLRRAVQDPESSLALRAAAARRLARLADAGADDGSALVPVADPATWWGLREWTPGIAPLRDPEQPVVLSASGVASYDACPLRWFLEREAKARGESSASQGFGMAVHTIVQLVADGVLPPDADVCMDRLDAVWGSIAFEAPWQRDREREEARAAVRRFLVWMHSSQRTVVGTETEFTVQVGDVVLRGSADRVEVDDAGRVHVVDFKTGRNPKRGDELPEEPQLGVYQIAAREGAFADRIDGEPAGLGGAELVWLRQERKGGVPLVQPQPALAEDGPTWADELLARTAKGIRGEAFPARPGAGCGSCAFHGSCPGQDAGRQVVP